MIETLWRGRDPFAGFPSNLYQHDLQGWYAQHPYLTEAMDAVRPALVVEIGVWKGASVLTMAGRLRELGLDAALIAIDTWRGSWEHWTIYPEWFDHLSMAHGQSKMMHKFMGNVVETGLTDIIVPLPLDSLNACHVLAHYGLRPDVIHLDGGHDYEAVISDLRHWWPMLADDGLFIGDDYRHNGDWPGVRRAFDEFFEELGRMPIEHHDGKCRVYKNAARDPAKPVEEADATAVADEPPPPAPDWEQVPQAGPAQTLHSRLRRLLG